MVTIRPATKADIGAVDALLARCYPRLLKQDYPPSVLVLALPRISRAQPELVTSGTYYVAEDNGGIVGVGGWTPQAPGSGKITRGVGHIRHVGTDPDTLRRGVGRALLDHIVTQTKAQGLRRLLCTSTRTAVPFYEAMGFERRAEITVLLGPGIDFPAIEMERHL